MTAAPRRAAVLAALVVGLLLTAAAPDAHARPRVVLAFLPAAHADRPIAPSVLVERPRSVLEILDAYPEMSLGLSSAAQGRYYSTQALLDITQGARTSAAAYDPRAPAVRRAHPCDGELDLDRPVVRCLAPPVALAVIPATILRAHRRR